uniref:Uncharacterized protein n=1 Tax=viral metagenome TaxID=1070528 RepID=A0A6C0KWH6_9ZZZZ
MPSCTNNFVKRRSARLASMGVVAVKQPVPVVKQQVRRSSRLARVAWLRRLRPRVQKQAVPLAPTHVIKRQREIFVMTMNPLFLSSVTEHQTPVQAAPRECTGWNCVCTAPAGYGEGRLNWCRFYDGLPPLPASPPSTLVARTPTATESRPSTPILSPMLLPFVLAALGVPILPSS